MTTATTTRTRTAPADSRMAKALELLQRAHTWNHGTVKRTGQRIHLVPGSKGETYWTSSTACTCHDFQSRGLVCKHAMAVAMHEAQEAAAEAARLLEDDRASFVQWLDELDRAAQLQRDVDDLFGPAQPEMRPVVSERAANGDLHIRDAETGRLLSIVTAIEADENDGFGPLNSEDTAPAYERRHGRLVEAY